MRASGSRALTELRVLPLTGIPEVGPGDDLAALVIKTVVQRTKIDPATIEDVYFGATESRKDGVALGY